MFLTILSFLVVMSIIVFVHELGHFLVAKRNRIVVEEFGFGYPPRLVKLGERDGTIYSINAIPFGGFVRMRGEDDPSQPGSFASASRWARAATLVAGPAMNFLLAIILFSVVAAFQGVADEKRPGAIVTLVEPGSPAEQGGLQVNDRIVAADGQAVTSLAGLQGINEARKGQPVVYTLMRPDPQTGIEQSLELTITPRVNPPEGQGVLGIGVQPAYRPPKAWEAVWAGIRETGSIIYLTFSIPATLIREGKPIGDAGFMGPVGIAVTTGDMVRQAVAVESALPVIVFVALLSAALGITNLLPLPALDGGRLLFVLVEAIRRRRIEPAQEGMVHLIGFGLLLVLVAVLTVREISALVSGNFPSLFGN